MKILKSAISLLIFISVLFTVTACQSYRSDLSPADINNEIKTSVGFTGVVGDDDYLSYYFENASKLSESALIVFDTESTSKSEYGIFKVSNSSNASKVEADIKDYISKMNERFKAAVQYTPQEYTKFESARTKIFGNYVVYAILNESEINSLFAALDVCLTK